MRLVFTSYANTPGFNDPETWLKRIDGYVGILESLGKDHEVVGVEHIGYDGEYLQHGVRYKFMSLNKNEIRFPKRMHRWIKELNPDVVFINGFIFPFQLMQLKTALGKKVKIIIINRSEKPATGIRKMLQRFADRYVYKHIFTSQLAGIEWVNKKIISNEAKIAEIMHASSVFKPMNREEALQKTGVTGQPVFLWVGRLDANKDPLTVLSAFSEFMKHAPAASLYMIYHTEELKEEILNLLQENEMLYEKVRLIGRIPHAELQYWYNSTDFILSASHHEGGGIGVCEAMSCGCIPILTNIPSFRMMTNNGQCGILYEPGNKNELLAALLKTAAIDLKIEKQKVLQRFEEKLSFDAIARDINDLLAQLK